MTTCIVLLRGVNVGGKNKIPMPELKAALEGKGFKAVETYINSGNIIMDSELGLQEVKIACEDLIESVFGLKILVGVVSAADLIEAVKNAPDWWNADSDAKHNAIFVIPPITVEEVAAAVGESKPEYERVAFYGNAIFWTAPKKTFSKTRWSKIVENKAIYNMITIRNANTTLKLAALAEARAAQKF